MARVDHLSYSAIITFLRNQVEFQKRYIAKVFDNAKSPSLVVGTAFHKAMEVFYQGGTIDEAVAAGLEEIRITSDYEIEYGKTGNREKMIQEYTFLVNTYFEEAVPYDVVDTEKRMEHPVHSVPMVGVSDLIVRTASGKLAVKDFKTAISYSSPTNDPDDPEYVENYKYLLQGYIYLVLAEAEYGEEVESVEFLEVKKSKNRDGTPQTKGFEYPRQSLLEFAPVAQKIVTNVFSYVNDDNAKFFPNPSDYINGLESMQIVSNMEEGFDAARVKRKLNVGDKFAPRNVTVDVSDDTGSPEELILKKFTEFGIGGITGKTYAGASVIRYTLKPNRGNSMSNIRKRADDIAIALKSKSVRIEAPIPGTDLVGVEIPNENRRTVNLEDKHLKKGTMSIPIGEDVFGEIHYGELDKMPHLLIAGQTGAGKSVMLNVILQALTKQLTPKELRLVLIDPKQVELTFYDDLPHLWMAIATDAASARRELNALVEEMERRYEILKHNGVRKIEDFKGDMPRIVVVIDEFADLMMTADNKQANFSASMPGIIAAMHKASDEDRFANIIKDPKRVRSLAARAGKGDQDAEQILEKHRDANRYLAEVIMANTSADLPPAEDSIIRIAQKARAVGIHLVLATQRPSADVVTGLIKANIPTKIAFSVTTSMNSKIILDQTGAEALTGNGDMLYQDPRSKNLERLQGLYC